MILLRRILSAIVLVLFYTFFALAAMELGVRVTHAAAPASSPGWFWKVPDSNTGWALLPNTSGRYFKPVYEYDIEMSVNSRGLRAPEDISYEKPSGTYRIIVLGDSYVEASQVELDESFPQRLGALIHEQTGLAVQVLNAGVIGWGNDQEILWLQEEGYKYHPDLIILSVYPRNDFMNNYEYLEAANQGQIIKPFFALDNGMLVRKYWPFDPANVPAFKSPETVVIPLAIEPGPLTSAGQLFYNTSALYRYMDAHIRNSMPRFAAKLALVGLIKPGLEIEEAAQAADYLPLAYGVYQQEWDADWIGAYEVTAAIYEEFQRTAVEIGAVSAAVVITAPEEVYPEDWVDIQNTYKILRSMKMDLGLPNQRAAEALTQADVPVLNLLNAMQAHAHKGPRLHYKVDGHYTPAGHELAARALYNFLADLGYVPLMAGTSVSQTVSDTGRIWEWAVAVLVVAVVGSLLWDVYKSGPIPWIRKAGAGLGTVGELLIYFFRHRQYMLLPLLIILLMFAGLLILAQASVIGPFIYTLI